MFGSGEDPEEKIESELLLKREALQLSSKVGESISG